MNAYQAVLITQENAVLFSPFIAKELLDTLSAPETIALGAVAENHACGALIAHATDISFVIQSIFISPALYGKGVGSFLLAELEKKAGKNISYLLAHYCFEEDLISDVDHFFLKNGFTLPKRKEVVYSIDFKTFENNTLLAGESLALRAGDTLRFLSSLSPAERVLFDKKVDYQLSPYFSENSESGILSEGLSSLYLRDGEVISFLLITALGENALHLEAAYNSASDLTPLNALFQAFYQAAKKLTPPIETFTIVGTEDVDSLILVEQTTPGTHFVRKPIHTTLKPLGGHLA